MRGATECFQSKPQQPKLNAAQLLIQAFDLRFYQQDEGDTQDPLYPVRIRILKA